KQAATSQLPKDRESLFYFNLREVPPKSTSASDERSVMQVAMQSRIKLFWRPKAITKKPGEQAEMRMEVSATAKGLTIHNPTPYYITLAWLSKNARTMLPGFDSLMLAPFATATTST
ncbi:fimbrial biogenesis chaperone, partial [Enterobacter quasiroggenkampii]